MSVEMLFKTPTPEEAAIAERVFADREGGSAAGRDPKWPFVTMAVGASVVVPDEQLLKARSACSSAKRNKGYRFSSARVPGGTLFKRTE